MSRKSHSLWVILLLTVGTGATKTLQTSSGHFQEIYFSDYLYLKFKEPNGKISSFYCNIPKCADWEMNQAKFKGKQVTITWQSEDFFFKELNITQKIKAVKNLHIENYKK